MSIDDKELEEFMPDLELEWTDEAQTRMKNVPFFVRKSVVRGIEQYAKDKSLAVVDDGVVAAAASTGRTQTIPVKPRPVGV